MGTKEQVSIVLPADLRFSNTIRNFVGDLLRVIDAKELWINRLMLVMDELFMNAVKYGSKDKTDNVFLTIEITEESILFVIEDMGTGNSKLTPDELQKIIQQSKEDTSLAKTSGRGLSMIVSNWTDEFSIEKSSKGGIKVIAKKNLADIIETPQDVQQVSIDAMPEVAIINFSQKLDVHDSDIEKEMIKNVEAMNKTLYIFDLESLNYINSVFIGLLAKLYGIIMQKKGKVVIINLSDTIKDTLNMVGLTDIIPVVSNLEEAKKILLSS
jgi:anti-sigma B factor antagonist